LASISHIAHLSVTTKTKESSCAWRAHYLDGNLVPAKPGQTAEPKPVAGRNGTQITVEDLFFNVPNRRRAFRSPSDEFNKIIDMVGRYAVHCEGVAFSCKKHGESGASISIQASATTVDRIRQIHGSAVANELVEFFSSDTRWEFEATGFISNANYSVKKTTLLLFINHRCVESSFVKKAIEQLYSTFLPKNGHPFIYLSLEIAPHRVDVNVHPTKREVHFLNEDEIIQAICETIRIKLAAVDTSRTFKTQTLLPGGQWVAVTLPPEEGATASGKETPKPKKPRRNSNDLVRTDTSLRKITSMWNTVVADDSPQPRRVEVESSSTKEGIEYEISDREPMVVRLSSVKELRAEVREEMHHELTEVFSNHTFVGIVDDRRRLAAIQGGVKLYLVDYGYACFEHCYQVGLTDFGNFGTIQFNPPLNLKSLLRIAAEHERSAILSPEDEFDVQVVVDKVSDRLIERREMLTEYFALEITPSGELLTIPLLIKDYTPPLVKLPRFLLRLGPFVIWDEEKPCFETFLKELASFYVPEQLPPVVNSSQDQEEDADATEADEELKTRRLHIRRAIEHVFFPAFKARLIATNSLMKGGVLEAADLKGLYRVFERC
jgi:DNA mismatch repair protein MLH1